MKQSTLSTLWLVVGTSLFYFLLNAISAAQGWPFKLPGISFEKFDRYAVALIATPVGLVGLAVLLWIGVSHARAASGPTLPQRLPQPFKLGDSESALLHVLQIVGFVLLPLLALASLCTKYFGGHFCRRGTGGMGCDTSGYVRVGENWDHFAYVPLNRAFSSREFIYQGGPDYWPFWTPIGICILWVVVIFALGAFTWNLFRRDSKPGGAALFDKT